MRVHEPKGAHSMQPHPQERIDSKPKTSPMAIIGAILAQGAIRHLALKQSFGRKNGVLREFIGQAMKLP